MNNRTPLNQQNPVFPKNGNSYKRRSLQSPFILNDLVGEEDAGSPSGEDTSINLLNDSFEGDLDDDVIVSKPETPNPFDFGSMMVPPSINSPSLSSGRKHHHRRQRSTASVTYTPTSQTPLPPLAPNLQLQNPKESLTNSSNGYQPFQFNSLTMNNTSTENLLVPPSEMETPVVGSLGDGTSQVLPKPSYRRGHRYKHSSVSMNMFQDPNKLDGLISSNTSHEVSDAKYLPEKYQIPTWKEIVSTITQSQKKKLLVVGVESLFVLLSYVSGFKFGNGSLSILSHILFYDVISNISTVTVLILSNFQIWKNSSLQYPFGLGRIEVLMKFALAVSLMFVGLDLFSHIVEELLISTMAGNDTESHERHGHSHADGSDLEMSGYVYELFIFCIMLVTIFTAHVVNATSYETKDTKTLRENGIAGGYNKRLSSITLKEPLKESISQRLTAFISHQLGIDLGRLYNSTTLLTLLFAGYSLYYPFAETLSGDTELAENINMIATVAMAIIVTLTAWRSIWRFGNILLLTSPTNNNRRESTSEIEHVIEDNIQQLDVFKSNYRVLETKISRVNTSVYVVILHVSMIGATDEDESKFRFYSMRLIKGIMHQAVRGGLNLSLGKFDEEETAENKRRTLIDLLNVATGLEDDIDRNNVSGSIDRNKEVFEVTIVVERL